jgi:uncharacterized UPF0146 family protein
LIETGSVNYKNAQHLWTFKGYPERQDNLLGVAAVIGTALVVKTVLNHFSPESVQWKRSITRMMIFW